MDIEVDWDNTNITLDKKGGYVEILMYSWWLKNKPTSLIATKNTYTFPIPNIGLIVAFCGFYLGDKFPHPYFEILENSKNTNICAIGFK